MGLGLFIAKTLLERSGAELSFANGREDIGKSSDSSEIGIGAVVEVKWRRQDIDAIFGDTPVPQGENQRILA